MPTPESYTRSIGINWDAIQETVLTTLGLSPLKASTKTDQETHYQMQKPFMLTEDMLSDLTLAERNFVSINHQDFMVNHAAKGCLLRTTTAVEILPNEVMTHYVPIPARMDSFRYYLVRNAPGRTTGHYPRSETYVINPRSYYGENRCCHLPTLQMGVSGDPVEPVHCLHQTNKRGLSSP